MKITWGTGIAIIYSLFVLIMLGFVFASTKQDHSLVSETYYEEDLRYQSKIDEINRTRQLSDSFELDIKQNPASITVVIPKQLNSFKGKITLFHPAYAHLDQVFFLETNASGTQRVPVKNWIRGRWLIKIEGLNEGKSYYQESYHMMP
jgi:hypothetical protein